MLVGCWMLAGCGTLRPNDDSPRLLAEAHSIFIFPPLYCSLTVGFDSASDLISSD